MRRCRPASGAGSSAGHRRQPRGPSPAHCALGSRSSHPSTAGAPAPRPLRCRARKCRRIPRKIAARCRRARRTGWPKSAPALGPSSALLCPIFKPPPAGATALVLRYGRAPRSPPSQWFRSSSLPTSRLRSRLRSWRRFPGVRPRASPAPCRRPSASPARPCSPRPSRRSPNCVRD